MKGKSKKVKVKSKAETLQQILLPHFCLLPFYFYLNLVRR